MVFKYKKKPIDPYLKMYFLHLIFDVPLFEAIKIIKYGTPCYNFDKYFIILIVCLIYSTEVIPKGLIPVLIDLPDELSLSSRSFYC